MKYIFLRFLWQYTMLDYLKTHCLLQVQGMYHHQQQQNNIIFFLNQPLEIQFAEYVHVLKCCPGRWLDHVKYLLPQCHKSVAGLLVLSLPVLVWVQSILVFLENSPVRFSNSRDQSVNASTGFVCENQPWILIQNLKILYMYVYIRFKLQSYWLWWQSWTRKPVFQILKKKIMFFLIASAPNTSGEIPPKIMWNKLVVCYYVTLLDMTKMEACSTFSL